MLTPIEKVSHGSRRPIERCAVSTSLPTERFATSQMSIASPVASASELPLIT